MSNKEALIVEVGIQVTDGLLEKGLTDNGLISVDVYTLPNETKVLRAAMQILFKVSFITSISEGGYSISFDKEGVLSRLKFLSIKSGDYSILNALKTPTVKQVNVW